MFHLIKRLVMKVKIHLNGFLLAIVTSACLLSCNGLGEFGELPLIDLPKDKNFVSESIVDRYIYNSSQGASVN